MMVPQTAAASLVSENRALGWPSTADSIPTCEDQEDHVAMATTATRLARRVVENSRRVVAIELLVASRGVAWRLRQEEGVTLGAGTAAALAWVEGRLATLGEDQAPSDQIELIAQGIADGSLGAAVSAVAGAPRPLLSR
jgi:histidine ammonia-lyase